MVDDDATSISGAVVGFASGAGCHVRIPSLALNTLFFPLPPFFQARRYGIYLRIAVPVGVRAKYFFSIMFTYRPAPFGALVHMAIR